MSALAEFQKKFPEHTWDYTPNSIYNRTLKTIQNLKIFVDRLVHQKEKELNFENVLQLLDYELGNFNRERTFNELIKFVSPCQEIRDAAKKCSFFFEFIPELKIQRNLYNFLCKLREFELQLSPKHDCYLKKLLLDARRNGVHLEQDKRDKLKTLLREIKTLRGEFFRNILEEDFKLKFPLSELIGMEKYFKEFTSKCEDSFFVTLTLLDVQQCLRYCQVVSTRQTIENEFYSDCINKNVSILEKLIKLRHELSQILGYETYVDYRTELLMAKNSKTVHNFLNSMIAKFRDSTKREMEHLLELKKQDCENNHIDFDEKINIYDLNYYQRIVEELEFSIKHDVIREYFPLDHVKQHIMEIFQTLLHLKFTKIDGAQAWHPDVSLYSVCDSDDSRLLGYFYLDLFHPMVRYTNRFCFHIQGSHETQSGHQVACTVMFASFKKPLQTKPCLLTHNEVKSLFHEFSHVMHNICRSVCPNFVHKTLVQNDYDEAISQMFENWVWEKECLKKISCHYQTKECLSDDLIDKLIESRKANISIQYIRQLVFSSFDIIIHTSPQVLISLNKCDTFDVYKKTMIDLLGINFSATFEHLTSGYDAQYYCYLWGEVISSDMFVSKFKKEGIFNPSTGLSFRKCILEPDYTHNPSDLLEKFLGRAPIQEPFFELAGILSSSLS